MEEQPESILKWFENQTIFISGGSGFLGKGFLYKLLKIGVPKIYILLRSKKGETPKERLDKIVEEEMFDELRTKDPNLRSKLIEVEGDVSEPGLSLTDKDRSLLFEEVTIVFHSAASTRFDESLKKAVINNLRPTSDMVELAKGMKKLQIFHHISTAFANLDVASHKGVVEKIYQRKMDWRKLITFVENTPEEMVNALEMKLLGASPNTYIFTKHLTEAVIEDAASFIPVMITRPPVVLPSLKEPYPGWFTSLASPTVLSLVAGKGILRISVGALDKIKAYAFVDTCVDASIVATWKQCNRKYEDPEIGVFNLEYIPTTAAKQRTVCLDYGNNFPQKNALWYPHFYSVNHRHLFLLGHLILHFIPGLFIDTILKIAGAPPRLLKIYRKLYVTLLLLLPFMNNDDNIDTSKCQELTNVIPEDEKRYFTLRHLPTPGEDYEYVGVCCVQARKLLGEEPELTKEDYQHWARLYWLDRIFLSAVSLLSVWYFPWNLFLDLFAIWANSLLNFYYSL